MTHVPLPPEAPAAASLMLRPQDVVIGPALTDGHVRFEGAVAEREFLGGIVRYFVSCGGREIMVDQPFRSAQSVLQIGELVTMGAQPGAIVWLPG